MEMIERRISTRDSTKSNLILRDTGLLKMINYLFSEAFCNLKVTSLFAF